MRSAGRRVGESDGTAVGARVAGPVSVVRGKGVAVLVVGDPAGAVLVAAVAGVLVADAAGCSAVIGAKSFCTTGVMVCQSGSRIFWPSAVVSGVQYVGAERTTRVMCEGGI